LPPIASLGLKYRYLNLSVAGHSPLASKSTVSTSLESHAVSGFLGSSRIGHSHSRPRVELKEVTDCINAGDLTASADIDRHDEIGQVAEVINRLQKTLQGGSKMKAAA
jgi:methyl-accepting chemotaxis protein